MTQKKTTVKKKKISKIHWPTVVLILSLVLIAIPTVAIGKVLYDAFAATGTPLFGNRFELDLDPKITSEQLTELESKILAEALVDDVKITLISASLRVNVDVDDEITLEQLTTLATSLYSHVATVLPVNTYFKMNETSKMYDLELHIYNNLELKKEDSYKYLIFLLNSVMEEPLIQLVSDPKNPEFVEELYNRLKDDVDEEDNGG
ncbi:MAG: hypothetical protein CVU96_02135 [Firmicutes bacterium HGW-Firmicutes-20]|jgi:hypothetical protein|nr:MAG: hypothetical protein CVU96_02135 [Firmicutes bacterium HGW-Firmicutes-20]PKM90159.1 MAG: hypothetical protein CVU85_01275 [Firmicutes bacterium HGW-Firmicutes-10]